MWVADTSVGEEGRKVQPTEKHENEGQELGRRSREKTYCFGLKSLDGLHVRADVVRDGFKFA